MEAVVVGADGVAVFDALHRRRRASDALLYAFDLPELDGEDLRPFPLGERKAKLARLLARKPAGIVYNEHTEEDGVVVFRHACKMGLEGIVSKRQLVCGLEAIKTSVARWLPSDKAVHGRPALNGKNVVSLVRDALAKCPDEIPSPATTELLFIDDDPGLRESIRIDISSATNDLHNGQWKAATVVAGSAAEALLFWAIQRHPRRDTAREPNKPLERWDLHDYAVVARELDLIGESTLTQTMLAKDFRNLIHPGRSQRLGQVRDRATALSALAAVEHIARNLTSRAGRGDADVRRPVDR
jgi:hypothetical protein